MGLPRRLLGPDETVVIALRPHVKVLFWPILLLLLTGAVGGFTLGIVPDGAAQPWLRAAVVVVAALVLARFVLWPFLVWWNTVYAVTSRRLVVRRGVLSRSGHDMPLSRLNDVSFSHGLLERIFGCGTLLVESAGEHGQLSLVNVPHVEKVQRTLYRLSDDARAAAPALAGRDRAAALASEHEIDPDDGTPPAQSEQGEDLDPPAFDLRDRDGEDVERPRRRGWRRR